MKTLSIHLPVVLLVFICFVISTGYAEVGVTDSEIIVGMSTALSGPSSHLGTSFKKGAMAYFTHVNQNEGIHGRKIKLIAYDDGYEPDRCIKNTKTLIEEDKVFCLFGNVGTPTTMAIKPIITEKDVPLVAPFTGAEKLRNPVVEEIFHYRASYYQEVEEFIHGIVDVHNLKKISCFYQDDEYGQAVLQGLKQSLDNRDMAIHSTGTYQRNTDNIEDGLNNIIPSNPDAVVMVGTYSSCAKFIIEGKKQGFNPVYMNVSFVGADKLLEILNTAEKGTGEVVTQVVPPVTTMLSGILDAKTKLKQYDPDAKLNFVSLEGYLAAEVFVEGLKKTGKSLTRPGFITAMESIKNLDLKVGNKISFSSTDHQGSEKVYPTLIKGGKYIYITNWDIIKDYVNE